MKLQFGLKNQVKFLVSTYGCQKDWKQNFSNFWLAISQLLDKISTWNQREMEDNIKVYNIYQELVLRVAKLSLNQVLIFFQ